VLSALVDESEGLRRREVDEMESSSELISHFNVALVAGRLFVSLSCHERYHLCQKHLSQSYHTKTSEHKRYITPKPLFSSLINSQ
jgi:hypothetical protein